MCDNTLQEKFWKKRLSQLDDIILSNMKSLYSWTLILEKSIADKKQWIYDKSLITGTPYQAKIKYSFPVDELHELTNDIIEYFIDNKLENKNVNHYHNSNRTGNHNSNRAETRDTNRSKKQYSRSYCRNVDENSEIEMDLSEDDAVAVHENENENDSNIEEEVVEYEDTDNSEIEEVDHKNSNVNSRHTKKAQVEKTPNKNKKQDETIKMSKLLLEQKESEQKEIDDRMNEKRKMLLDQSLDPAEVKPIEFTLDTIGNPPSSNEDNLTTEELLSKTLDGTTESEPNYISGVMKPKESVLELEQKAPTINALLRLSVADREVLEQEIFKRAQNKIRLMMPNENRLEILEPLWHREADRMIKTWVETH